MEQVREAEAYGPLIAALRTTEAIGPNLTAAFVDIVGARELATAADVASTLHERVDRWTAANSHGPPRGAPRFTAGSIPEALGVTDPQRALTERAEAMNRRARTVAHQSVDAYAAWTRPLGPPPG